MKPALLVLLLFGPPHALAQNPAPQRPADFVHVFFLDSSGSMDSRVGKPGSAARQKLAEGLFKSEGLFREGQPLQCFKFTVQVQPAPSSQVGLTAARLSEFVQHEWVISRENTDLVKVLDSARQVANTTGKGKTTLAWILTDNVNDPKGHGGDAQNTRAFYSQLFQSNSNVQRIYFFPVTDLKLVLYLLVLSPNPRLEGLDLDHFENVLGVHAKSIGAPRIRAKPVGGERPLEIDPRVQFEGASQDISAEIIGMGRRGVLLVHGLKENEPLVGIFRLRLRSRFDEWRIEKATVERTTLDGIATDDFPNLAANLSARLTPNGISVDPLSTTSLVYSLELGSMDAPLQPQSPFFSLAAFNPDGKGVIRGRLFVRIGNPKLRLKIINDPKLTSAVKQIFQLEDIEYFVPQNLAAEHIRLDFAIPVEFEVSYRWWTRWLFAGGVFLLVPLAAFIFFRGSSRALNVRVDGYSESPVSLSRGGVYSISPAGQPLAQLKSSMGGGVICQPLAGATVNGKKSAVGLKSGSLLKIEHEGTHYSYRLEILKPSSSPRSGESGPTGGFY